MIYSTFTCSKYIAVQTISPNKNENYLSKFEANDLCRFINGEIYHATAILGQIRTEMTDFKNEIKMWQQTLFQCGGDLYKTEDFSISGKEITLLRNFLAKLETLVTQPREFVLPYGHPLNPLFHQISAVVTQGERWYVQAVKRMPLSDGVRTVLNLSSQIAFLLSLYINEKYGYEHEFV